MDRATLKSMAKQQIKGNIGILFVIALVVTIATYVVQLIPGVGTIIGALITGPAMSLATICIYLNLTKGIKPEVKELFAHFGEFWGAFKVSFLTNLFTILWSLLFVIPGIIKGFGYSQAMYILAENPGIGAREALKKSEEMMKGHKMELFVLMLSFFGWMLLSAVTFGIAMIYVAPYMSATMANFYNSLKPSPVYESVPVYEAEPMTGPEL